VIPVLVSLETAKLHLRVTDPAAEPDVKSKLISASAIVAKHCKLTEVPQAWIETNPDDPTSTDLIAIDVDESPPESPPGQFYARVPGNIQAAILLVLGDLYRNRESGDATSDRWQGLLEGFRDPTMA